MEQIYASKEIGKRLKMARNVNGLKLEEVATILGTTKGALSRYESGERNPDIEMINRLSLVYKVRKEFLTSGEFLDVGAGQQYIDFETDEVKIISEEEVKISNKLLEEKIKSDILELVKSLEYHELKGFLNLELVHLQMISYVLQNSNALSEVLGDIIDFSERKLEKLAEVIENMQD